MPRPQKIARLRGSAAGRPVGGPPTGDPHAPGASGWRRPRRRLPRQHLRPRWPRPLGGPPPSRPGPGPGPGPTSPPGQGTSRSPTTAGRSTPPRLVASRTSRPLGGTRRPGPVRVMCALQRPRGSQREHVRLPGPVHQPGPGWPRSPGRLTSLLTASEAGPRLPTPVRLGKVRPGEVHRPPARSAPRRPVPGQAPLRPQRLRRPSRPRASCRPAPGRVAFRRPAREGQARHRPASRHRARHPRTSRRPAPEGRARHRAGSRWPAPRRRRRPRPPPRRMRLRPRALRCPACRRPGRQRHRLGSHPW